MKGFISQIKSSALSLFRYFTSKSIKFIIVVSFTFTTVIIMFLMGLLFYNKYSNAAEQNVEISNKQIIEQVSLNMDYYQKSIKEISDLLDSSIYKFGNLPNTKIEEQMNVISDTRDDIVAMAIFNNKGEMVLGNPFQKLKQNAKVRDEEWFRSASSEQASIVFSEPHVENLFDGKYSWVISLSKAVDFYQNGELIRGVLLIDMNFNSIEQLCRKASLGKRGYIYIIDSKGKIIYHPQQELIYVGLKSENNEEIAKLSYSNFVQEFQNEKRMITIQPISYMGWKIVGISYMDELLTTKRDLVFFSSYILLFGASFVILIFIFISSKITKPIKVLESSMKMVEQGYFDVNVDIRGEKEISNLANTFNIMVMKIKQLMNQIVLEQEAQRRSELNALQAQINPHFLYNTLDSIVWMAEAGNIKEVIAMVTALARLFRISISRGRNVINVSEEIEHARNYLIIQKVRYKNKFKYEIEADEQVLQYKTIKLILQPIIENAIYHGIECMVDEGIIKIKAAKVEDNLVFEISDNGLGMDEDTIAKLLSSAEKKNGLGGVGVRNVHQRLKLSYGNGYGVQIESEIENGTRVKLMLPIINYEE